jgi:hypothetical protein
MRVLWKALDGRDFIVEGETMDEILSKIAKMRVEYNTPTPTIQVAIGKDLDIAGGIPIEDMPVDIQERLYKEVNSSADEPDLDDMN